MHINLWRSLYEDRAGQVGMALISIVVAAALIGPVLSPYSPEGYTSNIFSPPSEKHLLGTDDMGKDILTRVLYGARTSLLIGLGVAALSTLLSLVIGGASAMFGGLCGRMLMRAADVVIVMPPLVIAILVASYVSPSIWLLIGMLSLLIWPMGSRIVRAQVLSLKERAHIQAARTFGAGSLHLLVRHIAPDLEPVLVTLLIQDMRRAIFLEAGISFLGLSDPAMISWGKMMHEALSFSYLDVWRWWLLPTGFALSMTIIGLSFIGSALETGMDPRLKGRKDHKEKCEDARNPEPNCLL